MLQGNRRVPSLKTGAFGFVWLGTARCEEKERQEAGLASTLPRVKACQSRGGDVSQGLLQP
jgi:hypothetical protein